jgi:hypothetical protein
MRDRPQDTQGFVRKEESTFDTLLRKAAQQGTRRETLGALLGSALLLNDRGEVETTKKAERRFSLELPAFIPADTETTGWWISRK